MGSDVSVVQSTTADQLANCENKKSVYLDNIRARMNSAKRSIVNLQNVLMNLKASQLLIQQRLNRSVKLLEVDKHFSFDKYQTNDHLQGLGNVVNYGGDPDSRINDTRNQLLKNNEQYNADLNRVGEEIKKITQKIKEQQEILRTGQSQINSMGKDAQMYITKDGISKRQYTEVYMLYQIHLKYKYVTENGEGKEAFSSDSQYLKMTTRLQDQFRFYAERNPFVYTGNLVLELDNPGSNFNKNSLLLFLDRLRQVMGNNDFTQYDLETKKYTEQMLTHVMHPFISQNLQRTVENIRVPDATNALRYSVETPSKSVDNMIRKIPYVSTYLGWDSTSYVAAMLSNFTGYISGLYNMPMCNPVGQSASEIQKQQSDSTQAIVDQQSATIFSNQLVKTKETVNPETMNNTVKARLDDVVRAIEENSNKGIPAENSLLVGRIIFKSTVLYQVRILNNASRVLEYIDEMLMKGNMGEAQYNIYLKQLQNYLSDSSVGFIKTTLP
jgi:hypothetical protein